MSQNVALRKWLRLVVPEGDSSPELIKGVAAGLVLRARIYPTSPYHKNWRQLLDALVNERLPKLLDNGREEEACREAVIGLALCAAYQAVEPMGDERRKEEQPYLKLVVGVAGALAGLVKYCRRETGAAA